jgi:hypothetical protein
MGPKPNTSGHSNTTKGRRFIGGINEKLVVEIFVNSRLAEDAPERGDEDIARGVLDEDEEDTDTEFMLRHRHQYSREHKLAAIDYFQTIWRVLKDGTQERLSTRYAARKSKSWGIFRCIFWAVHLQHVHQRCLLFPTQSEVRERTEHRKRKDGLNFDKAK